MTAILSLLFYAAIFGIVFALNWAAYRQKDKTKRRILIAISFTILICLVGFRYLVGTDYKIYLAQYNVMRGKGFDTLFSSRLEIFIGLIYRILNLLLIPDKFILFFYAIASILPIYIANKQYDYKYLAHSVLLYCVFFLPLSMNIMRQGAAISLAFLAFTYLNTGKNKKAILCSILSVLFHLSAIGTLLYIIPFVICKKTGKSFSKCNLIITTIISLLVLFVLKYIPIHTRYSYIADSISLANLSITSALTYLPAVLLPWIMVREEKKKEEVASYNSMVQSGVIYEFVGSAARYLNRFSCYFLTSIMLSVPMAIQNYHYKTKKIKILITTCYITFLVAFFVIHYVHWGKHEIIPYQTWLF